MSRPVYVYRIRVAALPEGSDEPGWEPDGWLDWCDDHGWRTYDPETGASDYPPFSWASLMRRKAMLSKAAAERRVRMLRRFGAAVEVERSTPVEWP